MIKDGFLYLAALIFAAAVLVNLPKIFKGKKAQVFFNFAPPIVLIYLGLMLLCTMKVWDLSATSAVYKSVKNPILYAMLFIMLLRCDLKKIIKLGPKMLIGFFAATLSIGLGFFVSYAIFHQLLGAGSWKALGALCGSWMGGGGNMLAIQAALDVDEATMAYALVMDSICATLYVMFLLWAIGNHEKFNKWTKADTSIIDGVGATLEEEAKANTKPLVWQNIILLLGSGLLVSAVSMELGSMINARLSFFDSTTWTVLIVSVLGIVFALTPFGKIKGTEEISNVMLYIVIALIASRADLGAVGNAPIWLLAGFVILLIHVAIMIALLYANGLSKCGLFTGLSQDLLTYGKSISKEQQENIINVMTNEFPAGSGKKTYSQCVFIEKEGNDYKPTKTFLEMLSDRDFYNVIKELVDFGISRYERDYKQSYDVTDFVLYQKYTYEDVCRLLNWEQNEVPLNIGGYKYDKKTKTFPVFINYDKSDDISDTTKYEDHFVPGFRDRLIAISKSGRSLQSEDVQNFLKAKERGIRVELFVRKNKDDKISKEFYYLGHMTASGNTKEFTMPNTQKTAVEIEWILDVPVREDIYEYIVNS